MDPAVLTVWNEATGKLSSFVYRRVRDRALTQDILQEVFLKVHDRLGQVRDAEKIGGWIYQITRNAIADHFRAMSRVPAGGPDWESDHQALNDCASSCLKEMLTTLPMKYRRAIELTELENVSQVDLARILGISYSGAKSRVQRAKQMLREKMEESLVLKMDAYGNVIVCEPRVPGHCTGELC